MRKLILSVILFKLLALTACMETKHVIERPALPPGEQKLGVADFVYSKVNENVFSKKCVGCHRAGKPNPDEDNPGGVNLQTYASTKSNLKDIREVVATGVMGIETTPKLTDREKEQVLGWIDAGAPQ